MADKLYYDEDESPPKGRDNLFLWTVFILLLIGVAFACWLGSFYVFGHPEHPRAYKLLKKLGKIEAPRRFEDIAAPPGEFLTAQRLYERYTRFSRLEIERENAELLRNYINNYRETKKLVPYLRGNFDILDAYELQKSDILTSGVVALMQSSDFPQVVIEHIFTAPREKVADVRRSLQTGFSFPIDRTINLSAVIHVEKVYEGRLQLTVVPLLYGRYGLVGAPGIFSLEPPAELNIDGALPVVNRQTLQDGLKRSVEVRRNNPAVGVAAAAPKSTGPQLVQVDAIPEGTKPPLTGPLPEMPVATPVPAARRTAGSKSPSTPVPPLVLNTTPRPIATPSPLPERQPPAATPIPRSSPQGVPLTPFIASNPVPGAGSTPGATWRTYRSGQAPKARTVTPVEAGTLADRGDLGERIYLRGHFVVTASGDNIAILRPQVGGSESGATVPNTTRIIAEYPGGAVPPTEGAALARDDTRPFEVRSVWRGDDGTINIRVREIMQPQ